MNQPPAKSIHAALAQQFEPSPLTFVANHTLQLPPRQQPSKLWELDEAHHCPIIGTCINAENLQQKLARKLGFECEQKRAFAQHVKAVGYCRKRNSVSEGLQKFLDRKYADWLQHFGKIDSADGLRQGWQQCRSNGDVAGPLRAIFTHRHCGASLRQQLYADIHMLSHQLGATQTADLLAGAAGKRQLSVAPHRRAARRPPTAATGTIARTTGAAASRFAAKPAGAATPGPV